MAETAPASAGSVAALWRHPVKSMPGEELEAAEVTERGLLGDRAYALLDSSDGKIASAKNPRKWPRLFEFRAAFLDPPSRGAPAPPVRITLPDGTAVRSDQREVDGILSRALGREVRLIATGPSGEGRVGASSLARPARLAEIVDTDEEGRDLGEPVNEFALEDGTFFDSAVLHLLTTATLDRLRALYAEGRFDPRRFRPNLVVTSTADADGFVENAWIGRAVAIGEAVRLRITRACSRCVMTTLPQADLPRDPGILRAAARHNQANVGVYASVLQGGTIRRGDPVVVAPLPG